MHSSPKGALTGPAGASTQRAHNSGRSVRARYALWVSIAVAILGGGYLAADRFLIPKHTAAPLAGPAAPAAKSAKAEKSIAVLPFVDMSEKHDQEYFSDGLSEELIDRLSRSATLHVISRTSCFYFKGKQATVSEIAKTLGVTHVLEGSVRKAGNSLRITAQLIRASDGIDVWSRTYDRPLRDIFKLQDEIAVAVDKELEIAIWNSSESSGLHSPKPAAYDLVLLARARGSFNLESFDRSIKYYREAIALDPDYALAWAGLASELSGKEQLANPEETKVLQEQARDAAAKALAIDPNLAAAHLESGEVRKGSGDWDGAEIEFEKANALKPGSADFDLVLLRTSRYGALDQAIDFYQAALLRDPLDTTFFTKLGQALRSAGRFEESAKAIRRVIEIEPDFDGEHYELAKTLLRWGKQQEALAETGREPDKSGKAFLQAVIY
jgi:TolB-like protein